MLACGRAGAHHRGARDRTDDRVQWTPTYRRKPIISSTRLQAREAAEAKRRKKEAIQRCVDRGIPSKRAVHVSLA